MKKLTVACNIVLAAFTALVLATDGAPRPPAYVLFTMLVFLVPAASVVALIRRETRRRAIARAAVLANVVLLGSTCWAIIDQYPHPAEAGFLEYVALVLVTPILSIVALDRPRRSERARGVGTTVAG